MNTLINQLLRGKRCGVAALASTATVSEVRQRECRVGLALTGAFVLMLSGCAATSVHIAASDTAQEVHLAATSALTSYEALRTVAVDSAYNQGYLRVVMSSQPDAVDFTAVADADMGALIDMRTRTCRLIVAAADGLRLACGTRGKTDAVQAYAAAVEALKGLSKPIAGKQSIASVASISAGDENIGTLISDAMARLRAELPTELAGVPVTASDLDAGWNGLPPTDAVLLEGEGVRAVARPSGTEPKLKVYLQVSLPPERSGDLDAARAEASTLMEQLKADMTAALGL